MANTINNSTTAQTDKPAPAPQPAPEQKTNTPVAAPSPEKITPAPPDQPIAKPLAETEITTAEPAQNADTASAESEKITEQPHPKPETTLPVMADEPKEKAQESQAPAAEQAIEQTEEIQEKNKTEPKIPENNIQKTIKELPHQEDDLAPFEIVEHEQEPPEKLGLKDAISTLPENEEPKTDINKAPGPAITAMPESAPAQPASQPALNKISRPTEQSIKTDFSIQFRKKLKQLLGLANQKRRNKVENNKNKIIAFAREHNRIDNKDVRNLTGLSQERAREYLDKLEKEKKLAQMGRNGPKVFYMPIIKK
ncbi:hypothetical protein KAU19_01455 [Candidatus Parcubacteria bacterium]|nr:hypothetical protein [Candidatus Parcubacteria bacterium]